MKFDTGRSQRTLVATEGTVTLGLKSSDGTEKQIIWSQPKTTPEGRKSFTRCVASVTYPKTEHTRGGNMSMFYDEPQKGADRYQLLVSFNGELFQGQKELYDNVVHGGTFSPDGKRLEPGTYDLG